MTSVQAPYMTSFDDHSKIWCQFWILGSSMSIKQCTLWSCSCSLSFNTGCCGPCGVTLEQPHQRHCNIRIISFAILLAAPGDIYPSYTPLKMTFLPRIARLRRARYWFNNCGLCPSICVCKSYLSIDHHGCHFRFSAVHAVTMRLMYFVSYWHCVIYIV